jgi:hypothetical protein
VRAAKAISKALWNLPRPAAHDVAAVLYLLFASAAVLYLPYKAIMQGDAASLANDEAEIATMNEAEADAARRRKEDGAASGHDVWRQANRLKQTKLERLERRTIGTHTRLGRGTIPRYQPS